MEKVSLQNRLESSAAERPDNADMQEQCRQRSNKHISACFCLACCSVNVQCYVAKQLNFSSGDLLVTYQGL